MTELNTSNMASQDPSYRMRYTRGVLQKSQHGYEWSVKEPLGILGSEVASESKWKNFKWTTTRTRAGGRYKIQGGIFSSKMWFGIEAQLNGQRHYL
jgi:hypothetical protein